MIPKLRWDLDVLGLINAFCLWFRGLSEGGYEQEELAPLEPRPCKKAAFKGKTFTEMLKF